jgi:NAD(P)H-dependent FMN reductase
MTTVLGLSGSLRQGSFNSALLRAAVELAPPGFALEIGTIAGIPLYDGDREREQGLPDPVIALKDRIAAADGLLLVTPEYNHSIPGVFKNAIDWCSRPPKDIPRVFGGKAVALIGATPGRGGTRFSQAAWLPVLHTLGTRIWAGGELHVAGASQAFDPDGKLIDAKIRDLLGTLLAGFGAFLRTG